MKAQLNLKELLDRGRIENELELERALQLDKTLRLLVKEQPDLVGQRKRLRAIIRDYEQQHWVNAEEISDEQIKESDVAAYIANQERLFFLKRKEEIKQNLKKRQLTQQDLGTILGHSKTYISELVNGVMPFSQKDLIIIHRLFHISLDNLIPTVIPAKDRNKLVESISKLNKPKLKLEKEIFEFA